MATEQESSVPSLIGSALSDTQSLIKDQIELTKMELKASGKKAAGGAGMLAGAAVLGLYAFGFLLITIAYVLVELGLAVWAGFAIVTLVLLLVTALLGLLGKRRLDSVQGPERSVAAMNATTAVLSRSSK